MAKVINSTDLCCYLTVLGTGVVVAKVALIHLIGKYSAGFGPLSAIQGIIMGFLEETIGGNLPVLVQAPAAVGGHNLVTSFALQEVVVPTEAEVVAYYTSAPGAGPLLNPLAMTAINTVHLAPLCLIPHAWAAYFMDSKTQFEAFNMGVNLIATLDTGREGSSFTTGKLAAGSLHHQVRASCGGLSLQLS
jgi:hypothetical protein